MSNKKAKIQQGTIAPVTNPEVKKAINNLKLGSTPEKQEALSNALKKARLLAPCNFDVELKPNHKGVLPTVNPTQIKFFLIQMMVRHFSQHLQMLKNPQNLRLLAIRMTCQRIL